MELDTIYNKDCIEGLKELPDNSIDLVVMDPPYDLLKSGGGAFGYANRQYHSQIETMSGGITNDILKMILSKCKKVNAYIWCNKRQLRQYFDYLDDNGYMIDLLTWHKTNPTPSCGNKYLSDTEYLIYTREKGVKLYGTYETKRKWYVSSLNTADKKKYGHPTVKPLEIIKNLITNSSRGGDLVLDPFMGSGTTAVAAKLLGRHYVGFEINSDYHRIAEERVNDCIKWF